MRAIRVHAFGDPDVLGLEEVPELRPPRAGEVLVRLHAAGVNPVDTYLRAGQYAALPPLPYTPGSDGAGTVEALGDTSVPGLSVGDRVYTSGSMTGTYAAAALCGAAQVHSLPDEATFAEGAALGVPYATAYRALFQRGLIGPGEIVLIHGASGGVGLAAVQLAVAAGLTVHGTAGSDAGLRLVAAQGAALVVDHREPGHAEELRAATGGRGYDLIVEMAAHIGLAFDLGLLAPRRARRGGRQPRPCRDRATRPHGPRSRRARAAAHGRAARRARRGPSRPVRRTRRRQPASRDRPRAASRRSRGRPPRDHRGARRGQARPSALTDLRLPKSTARTVGRTTSGRSGRPDRLDAWCPAVILTR